MSHEPQTLDPAERDGLIRLNTCHRSTMTQEQRRELLRIVTVVFEGQDRVITLEQAAEMTDRQLALVWLRMCDYITEGQYQREFNACVGNSVFPKKPSDLCQKEPTHQNEPPAAG